MITDANTKRRKENIRDILNNLKEGEREGWKIGKEEEVLRDRLVVERRALKRYCRKMRKRLESEKYREIERIKDQGKMWEV